LLANDVRVKLEQLLEDTIVGDDHVRGFIVRVVYVSIARVQEEVAGLDSSKLWILALDENS
jgi:hypothetical protein